MNLRQAVRNLERAGFVLAATALSSFAGAKIYLGPPIHLPPPVAFTQGRVVGVRTVRAYAPAIGGSIDATGDITCLASGPITDTKVYRIETQTRYYDFLKTCGELPMISEWSTWEALHLHERVSFRIGNRKVSLLPGRCEKLGLMKSGNAMAQFPLTADPESDSACNYEVTVAHLKSPDDNWVFRVIGAGPIAAADTTEIGAMYSRSLAPPF